MVKDGLTKRPPLEPGRRIYAIGDVHGHRAKLERMHAYIRDDLARRPIQRPLLVHLGDLIDRGPDSAGCVALLANGPPLPGVPTINLMGNHEWMLLQALGTGKGSDADHWLDNGGAEALASWGVKSTTKPRDWLACIPPRSLVLLRDLALHHAVEGYLFVHAGVRPGVALKQQKQQDLLWIRKAFLHWDGVMLPESPGQVVVHGHTPTEAAVLRHNRIGLDTGAGKGGPLTCAALEGADVRLFHVERA